MENIKKIKPTGLFTNYIFKAIPLAFDESLSYYECLCGLLDYLKNSVIPTVNNNADAMIELQNLMTQLQNYVNSYFDNLDVQEEINNKLDQMVEDGSLLNILSNYTNLIRIFNTVTEMINDETITLNQHIKCYGLINDNDGLGGEFLINNKNDGVKLNNGLYAKFLNNYENNYYDEIVYTKERYYDTDCYFTTIPKYDNNNNMIDLYVAYSDKSNQTPNQYSQDNNTTLTINASLSILNQKGGKGGIPIIIGNGVVLNNNSLYGETGIPNNNVYIGITENREIKEFQVNNTTLEQLQAAGCKNVFNAYYKLVNNFEKVDLSNVVANEDTVVNNPNPRQCLAEKEDGTIVIFSCDGRNATNVGLTSEEMQTILIGKGFKNAWNLDGGGSTSTNIKGTKINRNVDNYGTTDRPIPYTLNVKRNIINKNIADSFSQCGIDKELLIQQIVPLIPKMQSINHSDLNKYIGSFFVGIGNLCTNTPKDCQNGYLINLSNIITDENRFLYNKQLWFDLYSHNIYVRNMVKGVWSEWRNIYKESLEFVVFGDSWSDLSVPESVWSTYVASQLRLNLHNYAHNGAGFVMPTDNLIETQINNAQKDTTYDKNLVKYVILCGGINDYRNNVNFEILRQKIADLYNECKTIFPNAKILYVNNFQYPYSQKQSSFWYKLQLNLSTFGVNVLNQDGFFKKAFFVNNLFHLTQNGQRLFASNIVSALTGGQIKNDGVKITFNLSASYMLVKRIDNMIMYSFIVNNLSDNVSQNITANEELCWVESFSYNFMNCVGQHYSMAVAVMNDNNTITVARNNAEVKQLGFSGNLPINIEL